MCRVDAIRSELERIGVDEFCNRRIYREDMPVKLMRALQRTQTVNEGNVDRMRYRAATLTAARRKALEMMADGRSNKEIAGELGCSSVAASDVVRMVMHYFNARNRAHAVHLAHQQGEIR